MRKSPLFLPILALVLAALACVEASSPPPTAPDISPAESPFAAAPPKDPRILSMDVVEAQNEDYDQAMTIAKDAGVQAVTLSVFWDDLETAPGEFNPDPNWLEIANVYFSTTEVKVSLAISVIDTNNLRLPPDLAAKRLDDPEVIDRFNALLDYVASQIPDMMLTSFAIGNEIDIYLGEDAQRWRDFETFFVATAAYARTRFPGVPVGSKATFEGIADDRVTFIQSLNRHTDAVLVTYYPFASDFSVRPPATVHTDFQKLADTFPARPIYMLEVGYPSGEKNKSSEAQQAAFIHELFLAWDAHADQIPLLNYTWMTDMPAENVQEMTEYYRFSAPEFVSFLSTLGLRTRTGENKQGFNQWALEVQARDW